MTTKMLMMCLSWCHREFTFDVDVSQLHCYDVDNKFDDDDEDDDDDDVLTMASQGVHL